MLRSMFTDLLLLLLLWLLLMLLHHIHLVRILRLSTHVKTRFDLLPLYSLLHLLSGIIARSAPASRWARC